MARGSRWGRWLAVSGAVGVAVVVATATLVWPGPADSDRVELVVPTPPPAPPEVLPAVAGAPAPTADGIRDAIDDLVRQSGLGRVSVAVADATSGDRLYQLDPDTPAIPASTIKLVTAVSVLATLGPAHRIPTVALAGEEPGELVLIGAGDTTLAIDENGTYPEAARLDDLADQVREALADHPVTRVVVDATRFTGPVHGPWDADIPGSGFVGPVTALMTNGGRVDPEQIRTPADRWADPDLAAGEAFAELLASEEIPVERGTGPAPAPPTASASGPPPSGPPSGGPDSEWPAPGTELGRVLSPPVLRLVEIMLERSDNVLAEALARQVALARGEPASFEGAAASLGKALAELGVPAGGSVLADGSGLSRTNRLTAAMLIDLLLVALAEPRLAGLFAGLPVAGWSGTLADRYRTPQPDTGPGAGVVRAKTGTLSGVSALAGLVVTAEGGLLVFALLANDAPFDAPDRLDRIAAALAGCGCS